MKTDRIYTITITSTDDCGNISTAPAYVNVPHNQPILSRTSPNEMEVVPGKFTVLVTPNPSESQFKLDITGVRNQEVTIRITDMYGRLLETRKGMFANSVIQVNSIREAGTYFAEVIQGESKMVVKLIKQ